MIDILAFLLGIHLMMMLLASLYRIIDLWYCIEEHWHAIAIRVALLALVIAACYALFPLGAVSAFAAGQLFFITFHIVIYWIGMLLA